MKDRRPELRPVEMLPIEHDGERAILLRDPAGLAGEPILLAPTGAFLAAHFDGTRTLEEVQARLEEASGSARIPLEQIADLADTLAAEGFLEGPAFEARRQAAYEAWQRSPARPLSHAGGAYPTLDEGLEEALGAWYAHEDGPGALPAAGDPDEDLRAIFAPHIDPRRGGPVMAQAYHHLVARAPDADLFILLGTSHAPCTGRAALTRKGYDTPYGILEADVDAVERLAGALPGDPFASELNHRHEHSIEFQALFLAHALAAAGGTRGVGDVRILPILVGSFHDLVTGATDPAGDAGAESLASGIRRLVDDHPGRAVVVGGVDLAHIGVRFGGEPFTEAELPDLERMDRAFLDHVVRGDARGVFADVLADGDGRSYCGFPALWVMARALGPGTGRILGYGADLTDGAVVSFASGTL
jgi:MEMO1 family protein